jgi:uncharacterized protein DUF6448
MKFGLCILAAVALISLCSGVAYSHCDALDGPVITEAKKALDSKNVNLVLIWVQKNDEAEIRKVFDETLEMRAINSMAKEFADRYFFETLVRIHRKGEGAAYNGLKPAGQDFGPAINAADKAVTSRSIESAKELVLRSVQDGLEQRFERLKAKQNYDRNDIEAGREYVAAYVDFVHYVENVYSLGELTEHSEHSEHTHP